MNYDMNEKFPIKRLSKSQLYEVFEELLKKSEIKIINIEKKDNLKKYILDVDGKIYNVTVQLKNISDAGWHNKKHIRRIQTKPLSNLEEFTKNSFYLLGGIGWYYDAAILVCWNAQDYIYHKSNRSCYIDLVFIEKASEKNIFFGYSSGKMVYVASGYGIKDLIKEFMKDNYADNLDIFRED